MNDKIMFHISWLEVAIKNLKNNREQVSTVEGDITIEEFIKKYAKNELQGLHEVK